MSIVQVLVGVGLLLGGGSIFAYAVIGMANSTMNGELGSGLAFSGVVAIILGFVLVKTS